MSKLTAGDVVILLGKRGKQWADENGISTAEDMAKMAGPELLALAHRIVVARQTANDEITTALAEYKHFVTDRPIQGLKIGGRK